MRKVTSGERFGCRTLAIGPAGFDFIDVLALVGGLIFPPFSMTGFADPPTCPKLTCPANVNAKIKRSEACNLLLALPLRNPFALEKCLTLITPHLLWLSMSA